MQALFSVTSPADAEKFSKSTLDAIMAKRNGTIHRNAGFAAPTGGEVRDCANFLGALVDSLANVLVSHVAGL